MHVIQVIVLIIAIISLAVENNLCIKKGVFCRMVSWTVMTKFVTNAS